jgi:hypothetical protein
MSVLQAILALLGTLLGIGAVWYNRRAAAASTRLDGIAQAEKEVRLALSQKRFDDAAFWSRRIQTLRGPQ